MQNNKDYLDQSLDEIKLLKYVNRHDPNDQSGILQLYDYFYYKVSLRTSRRNFGFILAVNVILESYFC